MEDIAEGLEKVADSIDKVAVIIGQVFMTAHDEKSIADAILAVATELKSLGNNDADTKLGAIENLSKQIKDGAEGIASALKDNK